eukprot:GHVR01068016.1.p1 GENE.GHVR01068016.1~~GHVR01068016.1.p1  ORF type:complete len:108 (+),score=20.77 GHVR01068016.1:104-427(+)
MYIYIYINICIEVMDILVQTATYKTQTLEGWEKDIVLKLQEKDEKVKELEDKLNEKDEKVKELEDKLKYGDCAFIEASYSGHLDVVEYLIAQGANVNNKGNDGHTPL